MSIGGVGGASAHQPYIPPRRLDQAPRYRGFTPRSFSHACGALGILAAVCYLLPMLPHMPTWETTLPYVAPVALFVAIWPRKIRDRHWEEGELIAIRLRRLRTKGRRFSV